MPQNLIADSSALAALLSRDDQHHRWIAAKADGLPWPWLTCEVVLAETFHLLGKRGVPGIKELLRNEVLTLAFDLGGQLEAVLDLMDKYADVPMSLADACLVRMSEILPDPLLLTTDADFKIYRRHSRQIVPCLMP
ncbi:MAG TPA: PIN domain-containing protein [Candidatus Sulfotelmatobacter sp.]|nr:PIN domain-containing protein [Candidatus Sulfotelmatobacter sp.]